MPFVVIDPIEEAKELQEVFKHDTETKKLFKHYEEAHTETKRLQEEELELRRQLVEIRKKNNITQKELQKKTGLSQQAISRIEVGKDVSPSLKSLLKYADAIGCKLIAQVK